jgi:5'-nucleotidase
MPYDLTNYLVIGVSSRALFDLTLENEIYESEGLEAYCQYQLKHENDILKPGTGFALIEAMLAVNDIDPAVRRTEVVIISRNSADTSLRISNSINDHNLDITRAAFTGGEPVAKYLNAFEVDLFLSATEEDVQAAVESDVAAGLIYDGPSRDRSDPLQQIRIAFDGDAVLFSKESEMIYQQQGLEAFCDSHLAHLERAHRRNLFPGRRAQAQNPRVFLAAYLFRRSASTLRRGITASADRARAAQGR